VGSELLSERLDPVASILGDERLHPRPIVAVEDQILGALHQEPIQGKDLRPAKLAFPESEMREIEIAFLST
jgi:hypothetical protein